MTENPRFADFDRIMAIMDRAWPVLEEAGWDKGAHPMVTLKLMVCHQAICPLRLDAMLEGDMLDLIHDVAGINRHLNLRQRRLEDAFTPRYADVEAAG
jgi:hypothetical protein